MKPNALVHKICTFYVPIADTGDWSDGVTVTVMSLVETPPLNIKVTEITPDFSDPKKLV